MPGVCLDILILQDEDGFFNAICLQMDLVTCGRDLEQVKDDILELIRVQVVDCLQEGRPQDVLRPAPQEYWDILSRITMGERRDGQLGSLAPDDESSIPPDIRELLKRLTVQSFQTRAPRHALS
jgi:hypothetical protein